MPSENLTPEKKLNELVEPMEFDGEDIQLHVKAYSFLVRIDGTGWLDRNEVIKLRDWCNQVLA